MSPDRISDKLADIARELQHIAGWSEDSEAAREVERIAATVMDLRYEVDRLARLAPQRVAV